MKKYLSIICLLILSMLVLCACGKKENPKLIRNVYVTLSEDGKKVSSSSEYVNPSITEVTAEDRYIPLHVKIGGGYTLIEEFSFYINNQKVEGGYTVDRENQTIDYNMLNPNYKPTEVVERPDVDETEKIINKIEFELDTLKYTATTASKYYTIEVTSDKNYTYIFSTVTAIEGYRISPDVYLYVNGEYITTVYNISENFKTLVYKIDDPNWTPFY